MELKGRDKDVYEYIVKFMLERGYEPTMRDIADGVRMKSVSSAHKHFMNLIEAGYIEHMGKTNNYKVKGMKYVKSDV